MDWLEYFLEESIGRYEENNNASHKPVKCIRCPEHVGFRIRTDSRNEPRSTYRYIGYNRNRNGRTGTSL